MRPIAMDLAWSVCVSMCLLGTLVSLGWTDRDAVWDVDACGPKGPCIRRGVKIPPWEWSCLMEHLCHRKPL